MRPVWERIASTKDATERLIVSHNSTYCFENTDKVVSRTLFKDSEVVISDTERFVFIHVPKCAGTTIRGSLRRYDTRNNYYWDHHSLPGSKASSPALEIDKAHLPLAILRSLYPNDFSLLSKYTTFAVSRHPRTRLVSAFFEPRRQLLKLATSESHAEATKVQDTFKGYVTALVTTANFLQRQFVHAMPQTFYHVYRGKVTTDVIIKLEDPEPGIARLKYLNSAAGVATETALKSSAKHTTNLPTELRLWESLPLELQNKCSALYEDDCDLLGYEFNNAD